MPVDTAKAAKVWTRYSYARDNGHTDFVLKADKCDRYFRGDQWEAADKARLKLQRRPALTINKIISTLSNVMGEQIFNRSEISYRPRSGSPAEVAEVLAKVFKQISDNNQLDWKRSDMFADGAITSRGFLDVRIAFDDHMQGEVRIENLNMKNVVIDPDAEDYDPDKWNEVFITKWVTPDDIATLYSREDYELLKDRAQSSQPYGYDSIVDDIRDRFGNAVISAYGSQYDENGVTRNIRLIERQYRMLDKQEHFVSPETGDMRPVPENFDRNRKAWFVEKFGFQIIKKLVSRIKWTVVADNVVLHDEWSPYKHFTVVPFFPYFRHGATIGLVENLLDPQELLNKSSSQELHIANTTANSGWITRTGAVVNLSPEELEQRGAETGLVIEVSGNGAIDEQIQKIKPNQVPQALDRISYKAEEHIKTISNVGDSQLGQDRADVAAKAIQAKRQAGSTSLAKPLDSLVRSDFILARNTLDLVQGYYTEARLLTITNSQLEGTHETVAINQPTPEGRVINDLTLGEYDAIVSSVPQRETLEDSQFDQALSMREIGVSIDDETLIENSRLTNKKKILERLNASKNTPEARRAAAAQLKNTEAEAEKTVGEARQKHADADLKLAKAGKEQAEAEAGPENDGGAEIAKAGAEIDLNERKFEHEKQMDFAELQEKRRGNVVQEQLDAHLAAEKVITERAAAAHAAANPQPQPTGAKP
jgi:hypothetical protein